MHMATPFPGTQETSILLARLPARGPRLVCSGRSQMSDMEVT